MQNIVIHCQYPMLETIKQLGLDYVDNCTEIDVIVPDVEYTVSNGYYQDPDEQLCEHYGIDYNLVNCIEAV